jgi:tRNA U34 5-carboxymethylaminomethyl modifying enzyme MnmG/GidA
MRAKTKTSFTEGNRTALKHGGEAALAELKADKALTGLAAEVEAQVRAELETVGRAEIVTNAAIRLETVARLYWNALQQAAEANDVKRLDTYVKRFGWLQTAALRAWQQVAQEQANVPNALDYEQIIASEGKE